MNRLIVVSMVALLPHIVRLIAIVVLIFGESQFSFSQSTHSYLAETSVILADESVQQEQHNGDFGPTPKSFSSSVNGANASASANEKIVHASASTSVVSGDPFPLNSGANAQAIFYDVLTVVSLNGPVVGPDFALVGKIHYTRSGFGDGLNGDVIWQTGNLDNPAITGNAMFDGEEELTIPFGGVDPINGIINPKAELLFYLAASANSVAGQHSAGGPVSTSIELKQNHDLFGLGGGDAFVLGRLSGPDMAPVFTPDTTVFGVSARIVGSSGRVYKKGDLNTINLTNLLDASLDAAGALWNFFGAGSATTQQDSSGPYTQLETGSEVILSQLVDTPLVPMNFRYDVALVPNDEMANLGTLSVYLNSILIDQLDSSDIGLGIFFERSVYLNDPALLGLTDAEFAFHWDGPTGERIWLDNAYLAAAIPEPATWTLALFATLAVLSQCKVRS